MAVSALYTAVTGDAITAARWNNEFSNIYNNGTDIAFPLTKAVSFGGYAVTAGGDLTFNSGKVVTMTAGSMYWAKGADVASAAALAIGADGNYFDVTGTTTITSIASKQAGTLIFLQFDGALTLTHNATTLALPGNANITTAAGDHAIMLSEGSGNWRCVSYIKDDGSSGLTASTTEVLTGTDTSKSVTSDALAAVWEEGSDVASAGTISLGEGGVFDVTGTTTITDIDFATTKAGRMAWVRFTGALTLTHNSTTLILPTGANITTVADDTALFVSEGGDNVRCLAYFRKSGAAVGGGGITLGTEIASTSGTTIDFTSIPAGTKRIAIMFVGVSTNGTTDLLIQLGDAGGFETSGYLGVSGNGAGGTNTAFTAGFGIITLSTAATVLSGTVTLTLENSTAFTWTAFGALGHSNTNQFAVTNGSKSLSAELTQVRITTVNGTDAFDLGAINIQYNS